MVTLIACEHDSLQAVVRAIVAREMNGLWESTGESRVQRRLQSTHQIQSVTHAYTRSPLSLTCSHFPSHSFLPSVFFRLLSLSLQPLHSERGW